MLRKLWEKAKYGMWTSLMARRGRLINLLGSAAFGGVMAISARWGWHLSESGQAVTMAICTLAMGWLTDALLVTVSSDAAAAIQRELQKLDANVDVDRSIKLGGQTVASVRTLVRTVQAALPGDADLTGRLSIPTDGTKLVSTSAPAIKLP